MAGEKFSKIVNSFKNKKIIVLGDLMLDSYILGEVERISPEAPVPVVLVKKEFLMPGGSGNVAANISDLGGRPLILGLVGKDLTGQQLIGELHKKNINTAGILVLENRPTNQKIRAVAGTQQIVRIDKEIIKPINSQIEKKVIKIFSDFVKQTDAVVVSDYAKGFTTPNLIKNVTKLTKRNKKPLVCDPKPPHAFLFKDITLLTPNQKEAFEIAGIKRVREAGLFIQKKLGSNVLITQGAGGMTLFHGKRIKHFSAKAREVFDITGAGDTVIAVIALALASGARLDEAVDIANHAAGIVVGKKGTATVSVSELERELKNSRNF